MGIYDRDYYRDAPARGGFGHFVAGSVTTWLIVLNVAVFLADGVLHRIERQRAMDDDAALLYRQYVDDLDQPAPSADRQREIVRRAVMASMGPLQRWGYFSTDQAVHRGQVWRFVTFQFLHAGPWHLVGNMIALFLFGPIVEAHFAGRRYLAFYLLCGLAGAATYLGLGAARVLVHDPATPLVGASAGVFGLLVAAALISPHVQVFNYWGFPVTIGLLAVAGMAFAAYAVLALAPNAGGQAAHLGGGVLGFLVMKNQHWLNPFAPSRRRNPPRRRPRKSRPFQKDWSKDFNR